MQRLQNARGKDTEDMLIRYFEKGIMDAQELVELTGLGESTIYTYRKKYCDANNIRLTYKSRGKHVVNNNQSTLTKLTHTIEYCGKFATYSVSDEKCDISIDDWVTTLTKEQISIFTKELNEIIENW